MAFPFAGNTLLYIYYLEQFLDFLQGHDGVVGDAGGIDVPAIEEDGVETGIAGADDVGLQVVANHHGCFATGARRPEGLDKMIEKLRADGSEPNIQQVIDDMKEYRDGLMDTYDTMRDLVDEVTENVVNAYDE